MQIFQTSNEISTPEKLVALIDNPGIARYKDIPEEQRRMWIGSQIYALCYILHYQAPSDKDVFFESGFADNMIMDDEGLSCLKQVEMHEAFRRGIAKEYGEFYGITAVSIVGFLKGYRTSSKRQEALTILYKQRESEISEEKKKDIELYKTIAEHCMKKGIHLPSLRPGDLEEKENVSSEEHRRKIELQREEILKQYNNSPCLP